MRPISAASSFPRAVPGEVPGPRAKEGVDPLGFYLPPYAYAMMQVLDQAITATKGLDQAKLAEYIHTNTFTPMSASRVRQERRMGRPA